MTIADIESRLERERNEWLASLKAGDRVAVCRFRTLPEIRKVLKVTPQRTIVVKWGAAGEMRFDARGVERGGSGGGYYGRLRLQPITEEIWEEIERERLASELGRQKWRSLPIETLRRASAALEEPKETAEVFVPTCLGPLSLPSGLPDDVVARIRSHFDETARSGVFKQIAFRDDAPSKCTDVGGGVHVHPLGEACPHAGDVPGPHV